MGAAAVLDFNKTVHREQSISDELNERIFVGLRRKRTNQPRRDYVGASAIGGVCERAIQFEYAGAAREKDFKDTTLVKFDFGHFSEELARCHFWDAGFDLVQKRQRTGETFTFSQLDGRFRGTPDGVFIGGPKVIAYPALWEHKGVGAKTYREIEKQGLKKARPGYYAQVAIYSAYLDLADNPAVFTVSNLDSGERLHLLIPFDAEEAQRISDRAVRIVKATEAEELLPRPFNSADHFECRMCAFAARCWRLPG